MMVSERKQSQPVPAEARMRRELRVDQKWNSQCVEGSLVRWTRNHRISAWMVFDGSLRRTNVVTGRLRVDTMSGGCVAGSGGGCGTPVELGLSSRGLTQKVVVVQRAQQCRVCLLRILVLFVGLFVIWQAESLSTRMRKLAALAG